LSTLYFSECHGANILMVLTSHDRLGKLTNKTGWYLPEAAHPYNVFKKAGIDMTWASPKGGRAPVDPGSVAAYKKDDESVDFLKEDCWKHTKKLKDLRDEDFDAIFVVGGYGVMWDLVKDSDLQYIAAKIWEDGGIVSGVCHGPAALINVKLDDGTKLVAGKKTAGFTDQEENDLGRKHLIPWTIEEKMKSAGAKYTKGAHWTDHVAKSGRLITGQNPMSAKSTASAVVSALKSSGVIEDFALPKSIFALRLSPQASIVAPCSIAAIAAMALASIFIRRRQLAAASDRAQQELLAVD
jgi:putative intracellular protease/amidase